MTSVEMTGGGEEIPSIGSQPLQEMQGCTNCQALAEKLEKRKQWNKFFRKKLVPLDTLARACEREKERNLQLQLAYDQSDRDCTDMKEQLATLLLEISPLRKRLEEVEAQLKEETQRKEKAETQRDSLQFAIQQQEHLLRSMKKKTDTRMIELQEKKLSDSKGRVRKLKNLVAERDGTISDLRTFISDRSQQMDRNNKRTLWSLSLAQQYALQHLGPDWQSTAEFSRVNNLLQATKEVLTSQYYSYTSKQMTDLEDEPQIMPSLNEWLDDFDDNVQENICAEKIAKDVKINIKKKLVSEAKLLEQLIMDSGSTPNKNQEENVKIEMRNGNQGKVLTCSEEENETNSNKKTKYRHRTTEGMNKQKSGHCRRQISPPKSTIRGRRGRRGRPPRIPSILDDSEDSSDDDNDGKNSESLMFDKSLIKMRKTNNLNDSGRLPKVQKNLEDRKIDDENDNNAERITKPLELPNKADFSQRNKDLSSMATMVGPISQRDKDLSSMATMVGPVYQDSGKNLPKLPETYSKEVKMINFIKGSDDLESEVSLELVKISGRLPNNNESMNRIAEEENFVDQAAIGKLKMMQFEEDVTSSENSQKTSESEGTESESFNKSNSEVCRLSESVGAKSESITKTNSENMSVSEACRIHSGSSFIKNNTREYLEFQDRVDVEKEHTTKDNLVKGTEKVSNSNKEEKSAEIVNIGGEEEEGSEGNKQENESTQRDSVIQHIMDQIDILPFLSPMENHLSDLEGEGTGYVSSRTSNSWSSARGNTEDPLEDLGNLMGNTKSLVEGSGPHEVHGLLNPMCDEEDEEDVPAVFMEHTERIPPRCLTTQMSQGFSTDPSDSMLDDLNISDTDDQCETEEDIEVEVTQRGTSRSYFQSSQSFSFEEEDAMNCSHTLSNINEPRAIVWLDLPSPYKFSSPTPDVKPSQGVTSNDFPTPKSMECTSQNHESSQNRVMSDVSSHHTIKSMKVSDLLQVPSLKGDVDLSVPSNHPAEPQEENKLAVEPPQEIGIVSDTLVQPHRPMESEEERTRSQVPFSLANVTVKEKVSVSKESVTIDTVVNNNYERRGDVSMINEWKEIMNYNNGDEKVIGTHCNKREKLSETIGVEQETEVSGRVEEDEKWIKSSGDECKKDENRDTKLKQIKPRLQKLRKYSVASDSGDIIAPNKQTVLEKISKFKNKSSKEKHTSTFSEHEICRPTSSQTISDEPQVRVNEGVSTLDLGDSEELDINSSSPAKVCKSSVSEAPCITGYQECGLRKCNKDCERSVFEISSATSDEGAKSNVAMDHQENVTLNDSIVAIQDTKSSLHRQSKDDVTIPTISGNNEIMEHQETSILANASHAMQDRKSPVCRLENDNAMTDAIISLTIETSVNIDGQRDHMESSIGDDAEIPVDGRANNQTSISSTIQMNTGTSDEVKEKKTCTVNTKVSMAPRRRSQRMLSRLEKNIASWVDQGETDPQLPSGGSTTPPLDTSPQIPLTDSATTCTSTSPSSPCTDTATPQKSSTTSHIDSTTPHTDDHSLHPLPPDVRVPTDSHSSFTDSSISCIDSLSPHQPISAECNTPTDISTDTHTIFESTAVSTSCTTDLINSAGIPTDTQDSCLPSFADVPESSQKVFATQKKRQSPEHSISESSEISSIAIPCTKRKEVKKQEDRGNCKNLSSCSNILIAQKEVLSQDLPCIDSREDEECSSTQGGRVRRRSIRIAEMEKMKLARQEEMKEMSTSDHRKKETDASSSKAPPVTATHQLEREIDGFVNWNEALMSTSFNSGESLNLKATETCLGIAFDDEVSKTSTENKLSDAARKAGNLIIGGSSNASDMTPNEVAYVYGESSVSVPPWESVNSRKHSVSMAKEDSESTEKVDSESLAKEICDHVDGYGDDEGESEKAVIVTEPTVECEDQPKNSESRAASTIQTSTINRPNKSRVVFSWGRGKTSSITKKLKGAARFVLKSGIRREIPNLSCLVKHTSFSLESRRIKTSVSECVYVEKQLKFSVNTEQNTYNDILEKVQDTHERSAVGFEYSECQPEKWRAVKQVRKENEYQENTAIESEKVIRGNRSRNMIGDMRIPDVRPMRKRKSDEPCVSQHSTVLKTINKTQMKRLIQDKGVTCPEDVGSRNDKHTEGKISPQPLTKRRSLRKSLFGSESSSSDVDSDVRKNSTQIKAKKNDFNARGKERCGQKGCTRASTAERKMKRVRKSERIRERSTSSDMSVSSHYDESNLHISKHKQKRTTCKYDILIDSVKSNLSKRRIKPQQKGTRHPLVSTPLTSHLYAPDFSKSETEDETTVSEMKSDKEEEKVSVVTSSELQHLSPNPTLRQQANTSSCNSSMEASDSEASSVLSVRRSQMSIKRIESDLDSGKETSDVSVVDRKKPLMRRQTRSSLVNQKKNTLSVVGRNKNVMKSQSKESHTSLEEPLKITNYSAGQSNNLSGSLKNIKMDGNFKNKMILEIADETDFQRNGMKEADTSKTLPEEQELNKNREQMPQKNLTATESDVDFRMRKADHHTARKHRGPVRIKGRTKTAAKGETDANDPMMVKKDAFTVASRLQVVYGQGEAKKRKTLLLASPPLPLYGKCRRLWSERCFSVNEETSELKSHKLQSSEPKSDELELSDSELLEYESCKCDPCELSSFEPKCLETAPCESEVSEPCTVTLISKQSDSQDFSLVKLNTAEKENGDKSLEKENGENTLQAGCKDGKNIPARKKKRIIYREGKEGMYTWKSCTEEDRDNEVEPGNPSECWGQDLHIVVQDALKDVDDVEDGDDLSCENNEDPVNEHMRDSGKSNKVEESSAREEQKHCSIFSECDSSDSDSQLQIDYSSPSRKPKYAKDKQRQIADGSEGIDKSQACRTSEPAPVVSHRGLLGCLAKVGSMNRPAVKSKTKPSPSQPQLSSPVPGNTGFVESLFQRLSKRTKWNNLDEETGQKSLGSGLLESPPPVQQQLTVMEGKHAGYQTGNLYENNSTTLQQSSYTQMAGYQGIDYQGGTPIPLPCIYGSLKELPVLQQPQIPKDSLGSSYPHESNYSSSMKASNSNDSMVPTEDPAQICEKSVSTLSSQDTQQCMGSTALHPTCAVVKDIQHKNTHRNGDKPETQVYIPCYSHASVRRSSRDVQRKSKDENENEDSYMERLEELLSYRTVSRDWSVGINGLVSSLYSTSSHTPFLRSCVQTILESNPNEVRSQGMQFGLPPTLFKLFQVVCVCEMRLSLPYAHFRTQLLRAIHALICHPGLSLQPHSVGSLTAWYLATVSVSNQPKAVRLTMDVGRAFLLEVIFYYPSAAHLALLAAVTTVKGVFRHNYPGREVTGVEDVLVWLSYHGLCSGREKVKTELGAWLERNKSVAKPQKSPAQLVTKLMTQLKASGAGQQQEDLVTGLVVLGQWLGAAGVRTHLLPPMRKVIGKPSQPPRNTTSSLSSTSQQMFPQHINLMFERLEHVFDDSQVNAEGEESLQNGKLAAQELKAALVEVLKIGAPFQEEVLNASDKVSTQFHQTPPDQSLLPVSGL